MSNHQTGECEWWLIPPGGSCQTISLVLKGDLQTGSTTEAQSVTMILTMSTLGTKPPFAGTDHLVH